MPMVICVLHTVKPVNSSRSFPADVANTPMSPCGDLTGKTEVISLSDLMTLLLTWGVYIANRRKEHSKTHKTD
jgi:hypothetical protein